MNKQKLDKKIRRVAAQMWKKSISGKQRLLTLDPNKFQSGLRVTFHLEVVTTLGTHRIPRRIQRTFSAGKITKVPEIFAAEFLKQSEIIEVK